MAIRLIVLLLTVFPMVIGSNDDSINLLVRSSINSTIHRYCVDLATLPNGHTVNITGFDWHIPYIASPAVNACNETSLKTSLPDHFPAHTLLILTEHQCKMTEHAWHVEDLYGEMISLMVLTTRSNVHYELTYNTTSMPVSIPVLIFSQNDWKKINQTYGNPDSLQYSIDDGLVMPRKFRPAVLLMFVLVLFILLCGNCWAADEFIRKISRRTLTPENESTRLNPSPISNDHHPSPANPTQNEIPNPAGSTPKVDNSPSNTEPAILAMPYCLVAVLLCFAVGWLLLIYYFPKVMIYILQGMFCIGAFSSLTSCLDRLSYFLPILRRYRIPSHNCRKPCTCQLGPLNVFTLFAMIISLILIIIWYIYRLANWAWVLQDILGAAICITVTSVYRLGNMRVITLILLGFFLYDIFFVFITPYIPLFQPSTSAPTTTTTMRPPLGPSYMVTVRAKKLARNPSVMEQVALGIGTNGEVVPLLFALPMFIPESEIDPCMTVTKSMLGFGDVILPGILLTFCRIFDIALGNRWPIYYIQSIVAYFIGLILTHVALYAMNAAQPALLYLVPCILLSTIITGLCRGELKELYTGRRIKSLLEEKTRSPNAALLANSDLSEGEQGNQSTDVMVGISDAVGAATGIENR